MAFADPLPTLQGMDKVILVLVVGGIAVVAAKFRYDAGRDRRDTLQRIATEHESRGSLSPTADLFRDAGVPVPDPIEAAAPATLNPASPAGPAERPPPVDLARVLDGIHWPVDLAPLHPGDPHLMVMASDAAPAVVRAALDTEFRRLDVEVQWDGTGVAQIVGHGGRVSMTIHEHAPEGASGAGGSRVEFISS